MSQARAITDVDLARLHLRAWRPDEPCELDAPAAHATWDGVTLSLRPTGEPLAAAAALMAPTLAELLATVLMMAPRARPPAPTIEALVEGYAAAVAPFAPHTVMQDTFADRLAECRTCELWKESARGGLGRCDSNRCACTVRLLWAKGEACPEGRWIE